MSAFHHSLPERRGCVVEGRRIVNYFLMKQVGKFDPPGLKK
jgi:hypothetical protein